MKNIDEESKKELEKIKLENRKLSQELEITKRENEKNIISSELIKEKLIEENKNYKNELNKIIRENEKLKRELERITNQKSNFFNSIDKAFSKLLDEKMQLNPINYSSSLNIDLNEISIDERYIISDRDFYQDLICLICSEIVINPKSCKQCEKNLCSKCLDQFLKYSSLCPNCKLNPIEVTQLPRVVKNLLNSIKIKCPKDCETSLRYEELDNHLSECKFFLKNYTCKNCNKEIKAIGLMDDPILNHTNTCKKTCKYCKVELFLNQYPDHVVKCFKRLIMYAEFFKEMMMEVMQKY